MIPVPDEEIKLYEMQNVCYVCKKEFSADDDNKRYHKVRGAAHSICNLR